MNLPQPPEGILHPTMPWSRINPDSRLWLILKSKLTGRRQGDESYTSYVNLSDADADRLIANIKKDPRGYPSLDQESGTPIEWMERQRIYQEWLVETYLTQYVAPTASTESFVDTTAQEQEEEKFEEEIEENLEEAVETVEEVVKEPIVPDDFLDDMPDSVRDALTRILNKKLDANLPEEKKKPSSVSNGRILKAVVSNLQKIQGQLASIDASLQVQNNLLRSVGATIGSSFDQIQYSDNNFSDKLDGILSVLNQQSKQAEDELDKAEDRLAEARLEGARDVAGTEGFQDLTGNDKPILSRFLTKFLQKIGKHLGRAVLKSIIRLLPKGLRGKFMRLLVKSRMLRGVTKNLGRKGLLSAARAGMKPAAKLVARHGLNFADQGERLAARAFKPATELAQITAEKSAKDKLMKGGGENVFQRALKSKAVQNALVSKLGKEGAEKLTVKLAATMVPGVATAYGLGEGIARIAMGDVKGGFLSFGSAIPVAGWGFAAIDILRDIDVEAYTKHIEPNLPAPADENFQSFFTEALGVGADQYETGTTRTRPGVATLHGTEAIIPKGSDPQLQLMSPAVGAMISASSNFISQGGPAASLIAPTFKQAASKLSAAFGVPTTLAQTNVGGSFSGINSQLKSVDKKAKKEDKESEDEQIKMTPQEEKLLKEANNQSGGFFEKIMSFFGMRPSVDGDPPTDVPPDDTSTGDGKLRFGLTGSTMMSAANWSHAHFQAFSGGTEQLVRDVAPLIKKMAGQGLKPELSDGTPIEANKDTEYYAELIRKGQRMHTHSGPKAAVDVNMPGFPLVPFSIKDLTWDPGGGGNYGTVPGSGNTVLMHMSDTSDGKGGRIQGAMRDGGLTPATPTRVVVGEGGEEIVMPNQISTSIAREHLLDLVPAKTTAEIVESYKRFSPEILMYDENEDASFGGAVVVINNESPSPMMSQKTTGGAIAVRSKRISSAKQAMLMALYAK